MDIKKICILIGGLSLIAPNFGSPEKNKFEPITYYKIEKPENIHHFAGEYITNQKVIKKIDKYILFNSRWSYEMERALKRTEVWFPRLDKIFTKHGIPSDFKYVAFSESYLRNDTSGCGAIGFFQITKSTAISIGLVVNDSIDERHDPIKSAHAICYYIKRIKKENPDWTWTDIVLSYNMGSTAYAKLKLKSGDSDMLEVHKNYETNEYMYRMLSLKEIINNPKKYGFKKE